MTRLTTCLAMATAGGLALVACAPSGGVPPRSGVTNHSVGEIIVATTLSRGPHGALYREGAMAELLLRDVDGRTVDVQVKQPGERVTFRDLRPGTYVLVPAVRPCDGNCGYLDPRIDGCSKTLEVDGRVTVRVSFLVGSRCRIHTT